MQVKKHGAEGMIGVILGVMILHTFANGTLPPLSCSDYEASEFLQKVMSEFMMYNLKCDVLQNPMQTCIYCIYLIH